MQRETIQARERVATQAAPVDLEHGRFDPAAVIRLWLVAAAALLAAGLGGVLFSAGVSGVNSLWGWLRTVSTWLAIFGGLLALLSFATAGAVVFLAARGWWQHQERVEDWHLAQLDAYTAAGGQEVEREIKIDTLRIDQPLHVLAVVLHVLEQAERGERAPWSSTALRGDVWYGNAKLGSLGKSEAERFSLALGELGLVSGRRKGAAGGLVTTNVADALALVRKNYGKLTPGAPSREAESEDV